jgi:voltage-gated potassium channel
MPIPFIYILYQFFKRLWSFMKDPEFRGLLLFVGLILLLGAAFYHRVERWSWLDALYFCVITLTTIGYGDLVPHTGIGKLFTMVYILLGLGVLAVFVSSVAEHTLAEQRQRLKARRDSEEREEARLVE